MFLKKVKYVVLRVYNDNHTVLQLKWLNIIYTGYTIMCSAALLNELMHTPSLSKHLHYNCDCHVTWMLCWYIAKLNFKVFSSIFLFSYINFFFHHLIFKTSSATGVCYYFYDTINQSMDSVENHLLANSHTCRWLGSLQLLHAGNGVRLTGNVNDFCAGKTQIPPHISHIFLHDIWPLFFM